MKITFECEICGKKSSIKSEINKCEKQGYPSSLVGKIVWLNFTGHPEYREDFLKVKVIKIAYYLQGTHEPHYHIVLQEAKGGLSKGVCFTTNEAKLFYLNEKNENNFFPVNIKSTAAATKSRKEVFDYTKKTLGKNQV